MPVGEADRAAFNEDGFWPAINADIATIHKLLDCEEYTPSNSDFCPVCNMPFDKGKKRKLIDTCGHERCYSCMFRNEACPLCTANDSVKPPKKSNGYPDLLQEPANTHYGEIRKCPSSGILSTIAMQQNRSKFKSKGHFSPLLQNRNGHERERYWRDVSPSRLPRPLKSDLYASISSSTHNIMTQSCPTPPPNRRRFFNSKGSKGSIWSFKGLTQSASSNGSTRNCSNENQASDDEGTPLRANYAREKRGSQNDLYTRLGLLLGDKTKKMSTSTTRGRSNNGMESATSVTSLATLEANNFPSTNTSPVSTLTGSSETDPHHSSKKEQSSDSVSSLMSMSSHSNYSASPLTRRHSVTTSQPGQIEELAIFKNRKTSIRRSARSGSVKGQIDPKIRFAQYRTQHHEHLSATRQLNLKPLFFEVPQQEPDPLFLGRDWIVKEIDELASLEDSPGILITGLPGTGKTALILQLVEYSCFGRHLEPVFKQADLQTINGKDRPSSSQYSIYCRVNLVSDRIKDLASRVVAYHFCQADNNTTCMVPDFVHSIAAQLCQAPILSDYKDYLLCESYLQGSLSIKECIADPDLAFTRGVLEPLQNISKIAHLPADERLYILVDALCEAEYHRPDYGDTIASFLSKHAADFPPWLKIIATVRTHLEDVLPALPFVKISLDVNSVHIENIQKDLLSYINFRVNSSPNIQSNLVTGAAGQYRFCQHLLNLCKGSFLFSKLTLDLFEKGHLVAKSTSFKVLPVTLGQIYQLHFNLRFPTASAFQKVSGILSVALAALYPLTLNEIFYALNSLNVHTFVSWDEFLQRFKSLSEFLVKRMDDTYMFFHPSFREWLIRRDDAESNKFLCDLRSGHAAIAFRLSKLEAPLDPEETLELGHHILKAHIYKNMSLHKYSSRDLQSYWVVSVSQNVSDSLCSLRNVFSPNIKVSRLLLLSGASPDHITDLLGQAPALCLFANEGISEMVALLLEFGGNVELANNQGCTPLIMAATKGHLDVVQQLITVGAVLGRVDTSGRCALVHAARNGHANILAYLLSCDWVVHSEQQEVELNEAIQQALVAAASQGHEQIVEYLLDTTSVDIDSQCSLTGETALTIAATNGCHNMCSILINRGCRIETTNRKDVSPLMLAVKEGHWATTEKLIQYQATISQTDNEGRTPLIIAASEGHVAIIELLLEKGANISAEDYEGMTALSWACLRGKLQAAQFLLDSGTDVNHSNKLGRCPLDLATFQGNPTLTQLLMDRGALLEHADHEGVRPLDRAISCRNIPVVQCFLRKGAKLGPTTWTMAAGKWDVMLVLLNKLLEDGNVLYRKSKLREAAHRYSYALGKFPPIQELDATFRQLRLNFLLNYSRCKRKMNEPESAVDLATEVLKERSDSYEGYYARAKARLDLRLYDDALNDVQEALIVLPPQHRDIRRILLKLKEEIRGGSSIASSVDTLNCPTETSL